MFVSDAYEGAISEREIVIKSGFLDYIEAGDKVLADRGFTIQDLLAERDATLVIPPFMRNKDHLSEEEVIMTKILSKARIHIERSNERIKNFEILNHKIPASLLPLLSQLVFVVCCLVNFQPPLL